MSDETASPADALAPNPGQSPTGADPPASSQPPRRPTLLEAMLGGGLPVESEDKLLQMPPQTPPEVPQAELPQPTKSFEELVKEAALRAQTETAAQSETADGDLLMPAVEDASPVSAPELAEHAPAPEEDETPAGDYEAVPPREADSPARASAWEEIDEEPAEASLSAEQIKAQQQEAAWAQRARLAQAAKPRTKVAAIIDGPMVVVRFGLMRGVGQFRHNLSPPPLCGTRVVVRTARGIEIGEVTAAIMPEPAAAATEVQDQAPAAPPKRAAALDTEPPEYQVEPGTLEDLCERGCGGGSYRHRGCMTRQHLSQYVTVPGEEYAIAEEGRLLRVANAQDLIDAQRIKDLARQESLFCRGQAQKMGLRMKIVGVDHVLGGDRIIFYFTSENRIDFRKLVQTLSSEYHTRIEMRQVGARDEARLVADYEKCGQQCCCQSFLKELKPVSMRMAKTQKASLDPTKISGRCGRLMCCMRYEDETYEDLRKRLPKKKTFVRTAEVFGKVLDGEILSQMVLLALADGTQVAVPNESILERNVKAPAEDLAPRPQLGRPPIRRPGAGMPPRPAAAPAAAPRTASPQPPVPVAPPEPAAAAPEQAAGTIAAGPSGQSGAPGGQGKKKRRRRHRKGKPQANNPQGNNPPAASQGGASE